jgi:ABC-2 type transport system permease protein
VRTELAKQLRRTTTWVLIGGLALVPVIIAVVIEINPADQPGEVESGAAFGVASRSGLYVGVAAMTLFDGFLFVVAAATFAGGAIADEATWGNLRYLLVRPLSRGNLLAAKLAVAAGATLVGTAVVALVGLVAGGMLLGWNGLRPPLVPEPADLGRIASHLAVGTLYVAWSMSGVLAFALMLSTMTDSAVGAIGGALGFNILAQILDSFASLGRLRFALPTHYLDAWAHPLVPGVEVSDMVGGLVVQVPYVVGFCAVAWWWFGRKDVLS